MSNNSGSEISITRKLFLRQLGDYNQIKTHSDYSPAKIYIVFIKSKCDNLIEVNQYLNSISEEDITNGKDINLDNKFIIKNKTISFNCLLKCWVVDGKTSYKFTTTKGMLEWFKLKICKYTNASTRQNNIAIIRMKLVINEKDKMEIMYPHSSNTSHHHRCSGECIEKNLTKWTTIAEGIELI